MTIKTFLGKTIEFAPITIPKTNPDRSHQLHCLYGFEVWLEFELGVAYLFDDRYGSTTQSLEQSDIMLRRAPEIASAKGFIVVKTANGWTGLFPCVADWDIDEKWTNFPDQERYGLCSVITVEIAEFNGERKITLDSYRPSRFHAPIMARHGWIQTIVDTDGRKAVKYAYVSTEALKAAA